MRENLAVQMKFLNFPIANLKQSKLGIIMSLNSKVCKSTSGFAIPALGLGTFEATEDDPHKCSRAVETAIRAGYVHIDTAAFYGCEEEVGKGIANTGAPREGVFVCTKL